MLAPFILGTLVVNGAVFHKRVLVTSNGFLSSDLTHILEDCCRHSCWENRFPTQG